VSFPTPAVMAKPRPPQLHGRQRFLLEEIRAKGGIWTSGRAEDAYRRSWPRHVYPSNVRRDLCALAIAGLLQKRTDDRGRRFYTLILKDTTS
jgi:hypothetical protein